MSGDSVGSSGDLPEYMLHMVRRPVPHRCVVAGSTPVVAFGDPRRARVATLGINPSLREFCEAKPVPGVGRLLLAGTRRRLLTLDVLGLRRMEDASPEQVRQVVEECASYFERPTAYWWFKVLQRLLTAATDGRDTYTNRGACHLDLVQWATEPVWGKLDPDLQRHLLAEGVPHLRRQLEHHDSIQVVLLNGKQVIDQVREAGLAELTDVGSAVYRPRDGQQTRLYVGQARGDLLHRPVQFLGW